MFCCVVLRCVVLRCVVLCYVALRCVLLRCAVSYRVVCVRKLVYPPMYVYFTFSVPGKDKRGKISTSDGHADAPYNKWYM